MITATIPDLLRLLALPVFGWAALRDIKTRRVPNRTWLPLAALGVVLVLWDVYLVVTDGTVVPVNLDLFLFRTALSVTLVVGLAYGFWLLGGFGGADAKALMVLAVLFPTYPHYLFALDLPFGALPVVEATIGVFSLTILTNTVLVGALYPVAMAVRNAVGGDIGRLMFVGRADSAGSLDERYGRLLETPRGYTRGGMDLDVLRMYLRWRGCSLSAVRADPEHHRDPDSLPEDLADPGDGTIADGGTEVVEERASYDDPWGAEAFFEQFGGPVYGTDAETLREGLEVVTSSESVWYSPGIPFIVPMFGGLLLSLTAGDVLVWLMTTVGIA